MIAVALSATLVHAQEAENVGNSAQLSIIPRIDLNPYVGFRSDAGTDFSLSNSSLYTLLEGSFGEHFSYSIMNHWLSDEPAALYKDTFFHSDVNTWCDWANLTYSLGDFSFTAGKCFTAIGLWEMDAYDYESHYDLNTTIWNEMAVYQWGGDVTLNHGDYAASTVQLVSSPFTVKPFQGGVYTASVLTRRDAEEGLSYLASLNFLGYERSHFIKMLNAGVMYSFADSYTVGADVAWRIDKDLHVNEGSFAGVFEYDPSDKLNLIAKAGFEDCRELNGFNLPMFSVDGRFFGGLAAHYFPLKDNDALRLHAVVAYDNGYAGLSINIGALYNLTINIK